MSESNLTDEDIIRYLSHRSESTVDGVISVDESVKLRLSTITRECLSPLGRLDSLPLEVLHESLRYLDLQSLCHLSRVCLRGKVVVESLPEHKTLVKFTGHTFTILKQAKILGLHSITTLHAALHSERCISCGGYGPFLLLLSAERCCTPCLAVNQSLWMTSLPLAQECFGFTEQQLKALPVMSSIPGLYRLPLKKTSRQRSMKLTSVKAAKTLALKLHGSMEELETKHPLDPSNIPTEEKFNVLRWHRQAPLTPLAQDPLTMNDIDRPEDAYAGMGAIPFPSLHNDGIEQGLWCRGCRYTYWEVEIDDMDLSTLSRLVPDPSRAEQFLLRMQYKAWSKEGFLQHAKQCYSATAVISLLRMRYPETVEPSD